MRAGGSSSTAPQGRSGPVPFVFATLVIAAAMVAGGSAFAGAWAPHHRFHTLTTPHFEITFHEGEEQLAAELAVIAEEVDSLLRPFVGWTPRMRTQVVLVDATDDANGYAQTVPYDAITLYAIPPRSDSALDNHNHWLYALFLHEYAHVLQIDLAGGLPLALRQVFGRMIMPGGMLPGWLTEGYATWVETRFTTGGRGRSTFAHGLFRVTALEGQVPRLDEAEGRGHRFPGGNVRYLYGARFHFYLEAEDGVAAWQEFHRRHGRSILPFILPAKAAFGEGFRQSWPRFRADLHASALREAEAILRRDTVATRRIQTRHGSATHPRYTPDGAALIYSHQSPKEASSLRRVDRDGRADERIGAFRGTGSVFGRGRIYTSRATTWTRWESRDDLYRIDVGPDGRPALRERGMSDDDRGGVEGLDREGDNANDDPWALGEAAAEQGGGSSEKGRSPPKRARRAQWVRQSRGLRLADPAPHPTEPHLVAIQGGPGRHALVRVDPRPSKKGERKPQRAAVTTLLSGPDGSTFAGPTWSPDGLRLAVSVWKPGGFRDIHVLDADLRPQRVLMWDRALDADPVWSPDGRHLIFASDRDGTWNIHAYRWADGRITRLSNSLGAARHPDVSPDGRHIVWQELGATGWEIVEAAFDPDAGPVVVLDPREQPSPDFGPSAQQLAPLDALEGVPGPKFPAGPAAEGAVARARTRGSWSDAPAAADALAVASSGAPTLPTGARRYQPFRTLFPPRILSPYFAFTDLGVLGGLSSAGWDVLRQVGWSASIHIRSDTRLVGGSFTWEVAPLGPSFLASWSTSSSDWGRIWVRPHAPEGRVTQGFAGTYRDEERYHERRDRLILGLGVPLRRGELSLRYKFELRGPIRALPADHNPELLPARGSFSGLVLGFNWGEVRRLPAGISLDDGRLVALSAELESTALGAYRIGTAGALEPLHRLVLSAEARGYLSLPWPGNHVLAARVVAGGTVGDKVPQGTFRLGGSYGDSPYLSLPDRFYALRGYPAASQRGDHSWLATLEYRLPLLRIERGPWALPLWLRSIALSLYGEAGAAVSDDDFRSMSFTDGLQTFALSTRPSIGAELVGEAVVFWGSPLSGRVGYAYGFGPGATAGGAFYAQVGGAF